MVVRGLNRKKRLSWTVENDWKQVIFSDESQIVIGQNKRVYVWRSANEAYRPECMSPSSEESVSYDMELCNMARCWEFMQGKWKYQCRKVSRNSGKQPLARFNPSLS